MFTLSRTRQPSENYPPSRFRLPNVLGPEVTHRRDSGEYVEPWCLVVSFTVILEDVKQVSNDDMSEGSGVSGRAGRPDLKVSRWAFVTKLSLNICRIEAATFGPSLAEASYLRYKSSSPPF